jgi:osmotically inducible protein OsmC
VLYETAATGGRTGHVTTADGKLALDLSRPRALGGDDGPGVNPEQLFALGYAACFHSAVQSAARQRQLDISGSQITAHVGLGRAAPGEITLVVTLQDTFPTLTEPEARALMEAAHQLCPYSRACGTRRSYSICQAPAGASFGPGWGAAQTLAGS